MSKFVHLIRGTVVAVVITCFLLASSAEARYYNAKTGRFLTRDGIDGDDENRYAYVENNPVNYVDPYGEFVAIPYRELLQAHRVE